MQRWKETNTKSTFWETKKNVMIN
uniref:Uncharacterized protein n=1 Tax=Arundo donax TaxID=35708 RepID=A0A0A9AZE5_ARUDO